MFAAAGVLTIAAAIVWTTTLEIGRYGDPSEPLAVRFLAAQIVMLGTRLAALAIAALFDEGRDPPSWSEIIEGTFAVFVTAMINGSAPNSIRRTAGNGAGQTRSAARALWEGRLGWVAAP